MRYSRDKAEFDRAIAFIDGTFAVALTLLITTLDVGHAPSAFRSWSALASALGAQFVSFLIAFAVIAGYWLKHHRMVAGFVAFDTPTILANLCLIAGIVLLPFSTSAVGDPGGAGLALPTVLMAINVALVSVLYTVVWAFAARGDLLAPEPTSAEWRATVVDGLTPAAVFLASVLLAYLVSPAVARLSWLSLFIVNPLVGALTGGTGRQGREG